MTYDRGMQLIESPLKSISAIHVGVLVLQLIG